MSYTGYLQHVMGVFLVPKQQHTTTNNSWRFLASQPVPKIWKFLTSKNTNYQQKVQLFWWSNSWSHGVMVQVTYHLSDTICAGRHCRLLKLQVGSHRLQSQNGARGLGQERQPSHGAKLMPVVQSECTMTSGCCSKQAFSCNIKKTICTLCFPVKGHMLSNLFPFWAAEAFFSNTGCVTVYLVGFFPAPLREAATASPIFCLFNVRFCHICGLWLRTFCMDPGSDQDWLSKCEKG